MSSQQTIEIKPGWNWISFCVKDVRINDLEIICENNNAEFIYGDFVIKIPYKFQPKCIFHQHHFQSQHRLHNR